ncbi:hypothetical protein A3I90_00560 [Candidatus Nomurabacteria bacterium RIFCSPLOWO2_02_FULL_41_9]|nr:MAG: hypothetical protein A3I90_00560 [Candidatus Nomurabacteria bacterium RIFCSPLOWO2_02_FULL_41_9]
MVEKAIADWHEEGRVVPKTPLSKAPMAFPTAKSQEKKPIDSREKKVVSIPLPSISLKDLKEKNNNQRKPDVRHIADLRDALKAVVGTSAEQKNSSSLPTSGGLRRDKDFSVPPSQTKREPSPEELKKILDVQ